VATTDIAEEQPGESLDPATLPDAFPPFGTSRNLRDSRTVTITVPRLRVRTYAETHQPIVAERTEGFAFDIDDWIIGRSVEGNPVWWRTGRGVPSEPRGHVVRRHTARCP
jgi:hypothetical protein